MGYKALCIVKTWKNLLVWNHMAQSLDIWFVASPGGPQPSLFKLCPWGQKWPAPWVTCFTEAYIGKKWKKKYCLQPQGLEPWYLVWCIAYWTSTKFVQIILMQWKMACRGGHMFYKIINIWLTISVTGTIPGVWQNPFANCLKNRPRLLLS